MQVLLGVEVVVVSQGLGAGCRFLILLLQRLLGFAPAGILDSTPQAWLLGAVVSQCLPGISLGSDRGPLAVILSHLAGVLEREFPLVQFVLDEVGPDVGQPGGSFFPVHKVLHTLFQLFHDILKDLIVLRGRLGGPGDDQRRSGLIQQHLIDLIHQSEERRPLDSVFRAPSQAVSEIVEAESAVRCVGHIASVTFSFLLGSHRLQDSSCLHPKKLKNRSHIVPVALGQAVVDGDQMRSLTRQSVEIQRHHGGQCLPLARHHLGDLAVGHSEGSHHLTIVGTHSAGHFGRSASYRVGFDSKRFQALPAGQTLLESGCLGLKIRRGLQLLDLRLQLIDLTQLSGEATPAERTHPVEQSLPQSGVLKLNIDRGFRGALSR